jgi:hypothetical protein
MLIAPHGTSLTHLNENRYALLSELPPTLLLFEFISRVRAGRREFGFRFTTSVVLHQ